jgi:hypothetical protein
MAPLYSDCGWWPFGWGKVEATLPNPCDTATMSFDGAKCVSTINGESFCDPSTTKFEQGKCISSIPDATMTGESFCDPSTTKFEEGKCKSSVPSDTTMTGESFCDPLTTKFEQGKCKSSIISSVPSDDTSNKCNITIETEGPKTVTSQTDGPLLHSEWGNTRESQLLLNKYDVESMWIGSNRQTNGEYGPSRFKVTMTSYDKDNYECCTNYKRSDDKKAPLSWDEILKCTGNSSTYTYTSDENAYAVFATFYARPK